jgi:hypothetical protein
MRVMSSTYHLLEIGGKLVAGRQREEEGVCGYSRNATSKDNRKERKECIRGIVNVIRRMG